MFCRTLQCRFRESIPRLGWFPHISLSKDIPVNLRLVEFEFRSQCVHCVFVHLSFFGAHFVAVSVGGFRFCDVDEGGRDAFIGGRFSEIGC